MHERLFTIVSRQEFGREFKRQWNHFCNFNAVRLNFRHITFLLFALVAIASKAQEPTDNFAEQKNFELLDQQIYNEINALRLNEKLAKLFYSEILSNDALEHSLKMLAEDKALYTDTKSGQCIQSTIIDPKDFTYETLARKIAERWYDSPGHHDLMMGPFFLYAGIGTAWKEMEDGRLSLKVALHVSYFEE